MDMKDIEKYSSAYTLSDMEIFVFPELMYSLVLANIMSPVLWKWRELESFRKLDGKGSYRRLMRLRQFIMDEFDFNLDLETWGLTDRNTELKRFAPYLSPQQIAQSNALFGYEGDKYYFDVDIRKHFGLDKYTSDIIPYWKTETVEAMDAFRLKPGYGRAAGECVSLAALYAAAAFIVGGVPLEDIYMILTPLHSQNFLDLQDGILTNNRRLVTKSMWFNGTEISDKAQRALRNERVTVVAHNTGYIHCLYQDATIDPKAYEHFRARLADYLSTDLTFTVFASFLREASRYQKYFQICRDCHGQPQFMPAEMLYHYEHGSPYKIGDSTHDKLLAEVSEEDFVPYELPGRVRCDQLCEFLTRHKTDVREPRGREALRKVLGGTIPEVDQLIEDLMDFVHIEAQLPDTDKKLRGCRRDPDLRRSEPGGDHRVLASDPRPQRGGGPGVLRLPGHGKLRLAALCERRRSSEAPSRSKRRNPCPSRRSTNGSTACPASPSTIEIAWPSPMSWPTTAPATAWRRPSSWPTCCGTEIPNSRSTWK